MNSINSCWFALVLFNLVLGLEMPNGFLFQQKRFVVDQINGRCTGGKVPSILTSSECISEGSNLWYNSTITVTEDLGNQLNMTVVMEQCKLRDRKECHHFNTLKIENFCQAISSRVEFWGPMLSGYKPPYKCPIKKGVYRATNSSLDTTTLLLFPVGDWFWRISSELRNSRTGRVVMCVLVEARVIGRDGLDDI